MKVGAFTEAIDGITLRDCGRQNCVPILEDMSICTGVVVELRSSGCSPPDFKALSIRSQI